MTHRSDYASYFTSKDVALLRWVKHLAAGNWPAYMDPQGDLAVLADRIERVVQWMNEFTPAAPTPDGVATPVVPAEPEER